MRKGKKPVPIADQIERGVDRSAGEDRCWPWVGTKLHRGYGRVSSEGRMVFAHCAAYELAHGPIPEGSWVFRSCGLAACCNPAHMFVSGTRAVVSIASRLDERVDRTAGPEGCWPYEGTTYGSGYGRLTLSGTGRAAHRAAYELANGAIPPGMLVCHRCDNPPCCNPAHLFLGTPKDNTRDMIAKGRNGARTKPGNFARGSDASRVALTEDDVRGIRLAASSGSISQRALAARYGVTKSAVYSVIHRLTWSHVE